MGSKNQITITELKFNRSGMLKTMSQAKVQFAFKAGGAIRRTAQNLIRPAKRSSRPGQSPNSHTKKLKNAIRFAVESGRQPDSVIGPVRLNSANPVINTRGNPISGILENGGDIQVKRAKRWVRVSIEARPYMRVALRIVAPKLAGFWRGLFKKG